MIPRWPKQCGWDVYEGDGDGVSPIYCGPNAREDALSYARQRAGYAPKEIRVLDAQIICGTRDTYLIAVTLSASSGCEHVFVESQRYSE